METSSAFNAFQVLLFYEIKLENVPYRPVLDRLKPCVGVYGSLAWTRFNMRSSLFAKAFFSKRSILGCYRLPVSRMYFAVWSSTLFTRNTFPPGKKDASILLILPVNGSYDLFKRINGFSSAFESICVLIWLPFKARSFEKRWDIDVSSRICCFLLSLIHIWRCRRS